MSSWKSLLKPCFNCLIFLLLYVQKIEATISMTPPPNFIQIHCAGDHIANYNLIISEIQAFVDLNATTNCANNTINWSQSLTANDVIGLQCEVNINTTVTLTDCDDVVVEQFQFFIVDFQSPSCINCPPELIDLDCTNGDIDSQLEQIVTTWMSASNYIDNCTSQNELNITTNYNPDDLFQLSCFNGNSQVGFWIKVVDNCLRQNYWSIDINILNTTVPVLEPLQNELVTFNCDGNGNIQELQNLANNNFGATLDEACTGVASSLFTDPSFEEIDLNCFQDYPITVYLRHGCLVSEGRVLVIRTQGTEVYFTDISTNQFENTGSHQACIGINNPAPTHTNVEIQLLDNQTAEINNDYTVPSSFPIVLTFPGNSSNQQCINYTLIDDNNIENDENFGFYISSVVGGYESTSNSGQQYLVTLKDNDDLDLDSIPLYLDNCPTTANPNQDDFDDDGIGNLCDSTHIVNQHLESERNIYLSNDNSGVIMKSKNGTCWMFIVNDEGKTSTIKVDCP